MQTLNPQNSIRGLEFVFAELESIVCCNNTNCQFTHPSFQEVLTAKQFANEINSEKLSIKDAYELFWSYEEDKEFWGLNKDGEYRALLPAWKNIIFMTSQFLKDELVDDLLETIVYTHLSSLSEFKYYSGWLTREFHYLPFFDDMLFAGEIIALNKKRKLKNDLTIVDNLMTLNATFPLVRHRTYPLLHKLSPQDYEEVPENFVPDYILRENLIMGGVDLLGRKFRDPFNFFKEVGEGSYYGERTTKSDFTDKPPMNYEPPDMEDDIPF